MSSTCPAVSPTASAMELAAMAACQAHDQEQKRQKRKQDHARLKQEKELKQKIGGKTSKIQMFQTDLKATNDMQINNLFNLEKRGVTQV